MPHQEAARLTRTPKPEGGRVFLVAYEPALTT
jgi:hypothetical protein